jgi:hypothetical protein
MRELDAALQPDGNKSELLPEDFLPLLQISSEPALLKTMASS